MADTMYYNEAIKNRFLKQIDLNQYPKNFWDYLFKRYAAIEEEKGKDLCNFTKPDIFDAHKRQNFRSFETLVVYNINMKKYVTWAMQNGLVNDGMNHFGDFTTEELLSCVNQLQLKKSILTREEVISGIRELIQPVDAFVVLAIFEGIRGKLNEDLIHLKIDDFDREKMVVRLFSGKLHPVSRELLHWAEWANEQTTYLTTNGKNFKLYGNRIIKKAGRNEEVEADKKNQRNIYRAIMRSLDLMGYGGMVSANSLYTSGMIDMINRLATKYHTNARGVLYTQEIFDELLNIYSLPIATRQRFLLKYADFLIQ